MKNPIRDFFYFPKGDRHAVIAFGCIAVFCIGVLITIDALNGRERTNSSDTDRDRNYHQDESFVDETNKPRNNALSLHQFNPNSVDSITLVLFGIEPWKVKNFLHYRAAGKIFRSVEDLGKTYGWTAEDVEKLAPYVHINNDFTSKYKTESVRNKNMAIGEKTEENSQYKQNKFRTLTKIDVNKADSATLCSIPGIGGGISNAILRYRARLGGFHTIHQLFEINIVSPELLEWFTISDTSALTKLSINKASFQTLNSHPYITYNQTRELLRYIRLYGDIGNEQTLLSTGIFTTEEIEKLRPYIKY